MTPAATVHWRNVWKRRTAKYARWLHIYVSMASFAVVFFFAATGLTLNHLDWFSGAARMRQLTGQLETKWIAGGAEVAKLEVVEFLRRTHDLGGALTDFRVEDDQCSVVFKGPGYSADAFIDRRTGKYELTESRLGLVAIANDLHKGRDTGEVWKLVIDLSAGLLALISLSGLVLLYFIHKHRLAGVILLGLGGMVTYLAYVAWVP